MIGKIYKFSSLFLFMKRGRNKKDKGMSTLFQKKNRKGAMEMSFGMIFSIILIIFFIAIAIYAIIKFLDFQDSIRISKFGSDLQSDIDKMWKGSQGSQEVEYSLPSKIDAACFIDDEYQNLIFQSDKIIGGKKIEHLDTANMTMVEEQYCINNIKGKVEMVIKKDYGEALVTITRKE